LVAVDNMNGRSMKLLGLVVGGFLVTLISGCDSVYGPAFFNDSGRVVKITARFLTGPLEFALKPHQSDVQISSGHVLESFSVASDGHREEFGADRLHSMLRGIAQDDVLVLVHPDSIEIRSLHQAMREGLFIRPQQ
jgi:hypothetical protein